MSLTPLQAVELKAKINSKGGQDLTSGGRLLHVWNVKPVKSFKFYGSTATTFNLTKNNFLIGKKACSPVNLTNSSTLPQNINNSPELSLPTYFIYCVLKLNECIDATECNVAAAVLFPVFKKSLMVIFSPIVTIIILDQYKALFCIPTHT